MSNSTAPTASRRALLVRATALAATPLAATVANATGAATAPVSIVIAELLPPPSKDSSCWSGLAIDGNFQRWMFGASRQGEILFTFREDRTCVPADGNCFWEARKDAPPALAPAVREAILAADAAAVPADPIFALIEKHRATEVEIHNMPAEETYGGYEAYQIEFCKLLDVQDYAAYEMATEPTTIAGCVALLRYVFGGAYPEGEEPPWSENVFEDGEMFERVIGRTVADAIEAIANKR